MAVGDGRPPGVGQTRYMVDRTRAPYVVDFLRMILAHELCTMLTRAYTNHSGRQADTQTVILAQHSMFCLRSLIFGKQIGDPFRSPTPSEATTQALIQEIRTLNTSKIQNDQMQDPKKHESSTGAQEKFQVAWRHQCVHSPYRGSRSPAQTPRSERGSRSPECPGVECHPTCCGIDGTRRRVGGETGETPRARQRKTEAWAVRPPSKCLGQAGLPRKIPTHMVTWSHGCVFRRRKNAGFFS